MNQKTRKHIIKCTTNLYLPLILILMPGIAKAIKQIPYPPPDIASEFCKISTLKGTYAYSGTGVVKEANLPGTVYVQAGMETFDGKGHVVGLGSDKTSASDNAIERRYQGEYMVGPDCTGTLTYEEDGIKYIENIYVNPDGNALRYLIRNQGQFWAGEEQRISRKLIIK